MNESVLLLDQFLFWLCEREEEVVGSPGTLMLSPLAVFLSEKTGHVYGVNEQRFGRIRICEYQWEYLPYWAQYFIARTEGRAFRAMTGAQAFGVLVELESCSPGPMWSERVGTPRLLDVRRRSKSSQVA